MPRVLGLISAQVNSGEILLSKREINQAYLKMMPVKVELRQKLALRKRSKVGSTQATDISDTMTMTKHAAMAGSLNSCLNLK